MSSIMFTVFTAWDYKVSFLELISVITSTVGVVLGVLGVRITWPWWVGSSLLYAIFFYQVELVASAILHHFLQILELLQLGQILLCLLEVLLLKF